MIQQLTLLHLGRKMPTIWYSYLSLFYFILFLRFCVVLIQMLLVIKPLPTKLVLQKKAKEGRSGDEVEHFLVPSKVTVRNKSASAIAESNEYEEISGKNVCYFFIA